MTTHGGRRVLVTGGASGIGRAVVTAFVKAGNRAVIADVDDERADASRGRSAAAPSQSRSMCATSRRSGAR